MNTSIEERNIEVKSWVYGGAVYILLLLTLFFIKIVYNPPHEDVGFGVDLNYGIDLVGYGDLQTTNLANTSPNDYDVKPAAGEKATTTIPPQPRTPQQQQTQAKSSPTKVLTSDEDTKVTVKSSTNTAKTSTNTTTAGTTTRPVANPTPPQPQRTVEQGSIMKKTTGASGTSNSNGTTGTRDGIGGNNNGDGKPGDVGDQGDPRGTLDGKSLYGNPGTGGNGPGGSGGASGTSVSISGWKNKSSLQITKDKSNETGTIVYEVVINDFGDVINITNRPTSLSPSVVNYYREQIKTKLKSTLQAEGTPPSRSRGTITIRITRG